MKKTILISLAFLFILVSCKTTGPQYKLQVNEVRYFKTTIHNIDRDVITIANGVKFRTNRLVIAVNMVDAFFILNQLGYGEAYIDGTRYNVSVQGGADSYRYNRGYTVNLRETEAKNTILKLTDETKWQIIQKGEVDINKWLTTNLLVLAEDETVMINPYKIEAVRVKKLNNKKI